MNKLQRFWAGSLAVLFLLNGGTPDTQATEITPQDNGSLSLYFADQGLQCSFPFGGTVAFVESPNHGNYCKYLKNGGYFKLTNVPSASTIWLINGKPRTGQIPSNPKYCSTGRSSSLSFNWWKLTTIKQPTNMIDKVRIEDLKTLKIGSVVVPGVMLTDLYDSGDNPAEPDSINCAIMEVSP